VQPARPKLPRNVWVLGFVSMLMDLSSEIYHALLPVFITVTLGLPAVALGAVDGVAEATANVSKLASGRLSDRSGRRKPWVAAGYGLAALSKPLFPIAGSWLAVLSARFADRIGKGIRGAPRDAMIADETPPEIRGRAFGLRQSMDTVGAMIAPLAAIGLMVLFAGDIRSVFWIAVIPAVLSFLLVLFALREPEQRAAARPEPIIAAFRQLDGQTRRLIAIAFLFALARFSEGFLILKGVEAGLSTTYAPLTLVLFNLVFFLFAYPACAASDRINPKSILLIGLALLIAGDLALARSSGLQGLAVGIALWGAHMALTQGVLSRMVADAAPPHLKATSFGAFFFASGLGGLLGSLAIGLIWDRESSSAAFMAGAAAAAMTMAMVTLLPGRTQAAR